MENTTDTIYYVWFALLVAILVILFVVKLKFNEMFEKRQDRRKLLSYSKAKLMTTSDGKARTMKVKRIKDILKP
ncbi:MAG: hypothetical protein LBH25_13590 [Fibromonadaceae bacterium]|jgi:Tfp pilus assembly protein PilO|nr:hypothetical protein [Fibromonadaceae bacterium]